MFHNLLDFNLYLFDFDGLLVNTEEMHFDAYREACRKKNLSLYWTFDEFCRHAHYSSNGLRESFMELFPDLEWDSFYASKTEYYLKALGTGQVQLMPGVEAMLQLLLNRKAKLCVVTHSKYEMIDSIRKQHPILQKIPYWITREEYKEPKPSPDGYLTAINRYLAPGEKAIGFEDSPKGLQSLRSSGAQGVWVTKVNYPEIATKIKEGVWVYASFEKILGDIQL